MKYSIGPLPGLDGLALTRFGLPIVFFGKNSRERSAVFRRKRFSGKSEYVEMRVPGNGTFKHDIVYRTGFAADNDVPPRYAEARVMLNTYAALRVPMEVEADGIFVCGMTVALDTLDVIELDYLKEFYL